MANLSEMIIQGAEKNNDAIGHSVGDAIQAYHTVSSAENARQELEMEKSNHEMNKANFVLQGLSKANSLTGPMQKEYIKSFGAQWQRMDPSADVTGLQTLVKSDGDLRNYLAAAKQLSDTGGITNNDQAAYLAKAGSLEGVQKMLDDYENHKAMVEAARLKAESYNGRVNVQQDNSVMMAGDKFDKDPNLQKLLPMGQSLGRDLRTLSHNSKDAPVTYQTLHESLMNVASVLGAGALSDARVNSITPHVSDEMRSKIEQFFGDDPNRAADPKYVDYVRNLVTRLHGAVKSDVGDRADQIGSGRDASLYHNPAVGKAIQQKHDYLKSGAWMTAQQQQAQAALQAPPPTYTVEQLAHMTDDQIAEIYKKSIGQ